MQQEGATIADSTIINTNKCVNLWTHEYCYTFIGHDSLVGMLAVNTFYLLGTILVYPVFYDG